MNIRLFLVSMTSVFVAAVGCRPDTEDPPPVPAPPAEVEANAPAAAGAAGAVESVLQIPEVVATIGDREVTRAEYAAELETKQRQLDAELAVLRERTRRDYQSQQLSPLSRQDILDNLVAKILLKELAAEAGFEVSDAEVDTRMAEGQENLSGAEQYQEYLEWYNLTEEQLRVQIRDQILTEKYLSEQIEPCVITDEEVRAKFEELKAANQLEGPAEVDFRHVLLMVPPGSPESVWDTRKEEITALRERIAGGEDFAEVATEASEDPSAPRNAGLYEFIARDMMVPPVDEYLFTGPLDAISEPIQTSYGWHIVRIEDRREEGPRTYEQVEERLRESLRANCDARRAQEFVAAKMAEHDARILYTVPGAEEQRAAMEQEAAPDGMQIDVEGVAELNDAPADEGVAEEIDGEEESATEAPAP